MNPMPKMKDYATVEVPAWQVTCTREGCRVSQVVHGPAASHDALDWAQDHYREVHYQQDKDANR